MAVRQRAEVGEEPSATDRQVIRQTSRDNCRLLDSHRRFVAVRRIGRGIDHRIGSGEGVHIGGDEQLSGAEVEVRPGRPAVVDPPSRIAGTGAIPRIESLGVGFVRADGINSQRERRIELRCKALLGGSQGRVRLALHLPKPLLKSGICSRGSRWARRPWRDRLPRHFVHLQSQLSELFFHQSHLFLQILDLRSRRRSRILGEDLGMSTHDTERKNDYTDEYT